MFMIDKVLLNDKEFIFKEEYLPCLAHYGEKMGGSHLSIVFVAQLFLQGSKILFLTAYPMAKEKFLEQIGGDHSNVAFINKIEDLVDNTSAQALMVESGNESLFLEVINKLSDLDERVVLVKNIEKFSSKVFDTCLFLEKVILSGHLDECIDKDRISQKKYNTIIAFSQPPVSLSIQLPHLEKWTGYCVCPVDTGIIKILKD